MNSLQGCIEKCRLQSTSLDPEDKRLFAMTPAEDCNEKANQ